MPASPMRSISRGAGALCLSKRCKSSVRRAGVTQGRIGQGGIDQRVAINASNLFCALYEQAAYPLLIVERIIHLAADTIEQREFMDAFPVTLQQARILQ